MKKLPLYKRVPFDTNEFTGALYKNGMDPDELAEKIGVAPGYFQEAVRRKTINPAALIEARNHMKFSIFDVCPDMVMTRMNNGRATKSGRLQVDWDAIDKIIREEGYSYERLSEMMGHSQSYLRGARAVGGLSADMINKLAEILSVDPIVLTDYIEPHAANIIYLINSQHYE